MTNIIKTLEAEQMNKKIPAFKAGDTVSVQVRVKEGARERLQAFEGVVIAKRNRGLNSSFTVRKISHGEGVERVFISYSALIESISVIRHGSVRKAKLYYLRDLTGRKARIKEQIGRKNFDTDMLIADDVDASAEDNIEEIEVEVVEENTTTKEKTK